MSDEELRNKFASAVLSWITEATEALSNCPTILTSDMEHVSSMQAQCAEAYSHMVYGRPTNHDAAPAATASDGGDDGLQARLAGTGDTQEPVAWAVSDPDGFIRILAFTKEHACELRKSASERIVPLYRHDILRG